MNVTTAMLIALGGSLGTLARYFLSVAAQSISQTFPWGTILINIAGSFAIGLFGTLTVANGRFPVSDSARLFVMVGLCGGFTTFSSFSLQTLDLLRGGALTRALANIGLSVMLCLAAVAAGHVIATWLNGGAMSMARFTRDDDV